MQSSLQNKCKNVLVLLSGGVDSTSCVEYYTFRDYNVSSLFVDYGQPNSEREFIAASAISSHYRIPQRRLAVSECCVPHGYVPARNALLLSLALMNFGHDCGIISIGIHAGTPYADCSPNFECSMQQVMDIYTDGQVRIDAPFLQWTKSEILEYAQTMHVPLHLTFSSKIADFKPVADE